MGDLRIVYNHDGFGKGVESEVQHSVDANSRSAVTTTMGVNLSKANDYTIAVQMTDGTTFYVRPDCEDELLKAAAMSKNIVNRSGADFGQLRVIQAGKEIGQVAPEELEKVYSKARR